MDASIWKKYHAAIEKNDAYLPGTLKVAPFVDVPAAIRPD